MRGLQPEGRRIEHTERIWGRMSELGNWGRYRGYGDHRERRLWQRERIFGRESWVLGSGGRGRVTKKRLLRAKKDFSGLGLGLSWTET